MSPYAVLSLVLGPRGLVNAVALCVLTIACAAEAPEPPVLSAVPNVTSYPTPAGPETSAATLTPADPVTLLPVLPTSTLSPGPPAGPLKALVHKSLAELSPDAEQTSQSREGRLGVAVLVPAGGVMYSYNGDQLMSMASVVKVAVMLTTLDRSVRENREVTKWELSQLEPMIQESDNDATTALWEEFGGAEAVRDYLRSIGVDEIEPNPEDYWGASRASAKAVALLFAKIAFGDILDASRRKLAIELLSGVVPSQRWGVTAGIPDERPEGTIIGLKDGWYPAGFGWWVNSAGMLIPGDDRPAYTIAVLTRGQPSWEYGIESIEKVAGPVHAALHGSPPSSRK